MNFLLDLLIIAAGIGVLILFASAPRGMTFFASMLVCGYIGSSAGFWGTLGGLWLGIFPGVILVFVIDLIRFGLSEKPKQKKTARRKKR